MLDKLIELLTIIFKIDGGRDAARATARVARTIQRGRWFVASFVERDTQGDEVLFEAEQGLQILLFLCDGAGQRYFHGSYGMSQSIQAGMYADFACYDLVDDQFDTMSDGRHGITANHGRASAYFVGDLLQCEEAGGVHIFIAFCLLEANA